MAEKSQDPRLLWVISILICWYSDAKSPIFSESDLVPHKGGDLHDHSAPFTCKPRSTKPGFSPFVHHHFSTFVERSQTASTMHASDTITIITIIVNKSSRVMRLGKLSSTIAILFYLVTDTSLGGRVRVTLAICGVGSSSMLACALHHPMILKGPGSPSWCHACISRHFLFGPSKPCLRFQLSKANLGPDV